MVNVLHVITGTSIGGAEMMLYRYLRALGQDRLRHGVVSMMPEGAMSHAIRQLGVSVDTLDVASFRGLPAGIVGLRRMIGRAQPDVVHGWMYHGSLVATLALLLARQKQVGLVWGIHHSLADPRREKASTRAVLQMLRRIENRADIVTYCARQSRVQHLEFGFRTDRNRFVPNAIDTTEFQPDASARDRLRDAAGIPEGRRIVGTISRAHPMKDHITFAQTVAQLVHDGHDVHGVVIGEGQPEGPAMQTARAAGIADRFSALPARPDIAALVPGLDAYVVSSAWGEALSLAAAEAMAAGVPAVVTDVGDCSWLVNDDSAVCPPGRPDLLAGAVARILNLSPDRYRALGMQARARVVDALSLDAYVRNHAAVYTAAVSRREPGTLIGEAA